MMREELDFNEKRDDRTREKGVGLFSDILLKTGLLNFSKSGFYEEESGALLSARERGC